MVDTPVRSVVLYGMTSGVSARGFMRGQGPFLNQRGWDVALACSDEGGVEEFAASEGVRFFPLPLQRDPSVLSDFRGWIALWRTLRAVDPDVTVWGSPKASLFGTLACRLQRIPAIYVMHGLRLEGATGLARAVLRLLEAATCRLATEVVADGFGLRDLAEELRLVRRGRAVVLANGSANGVDSDLGEPRYRDELKLGTDDLIVAFAGRITNDKGIADLVAAWKVIADTHPRAHLVIAGRPDNGNPRSFELKESLEQLPRTHLIGHVDDLERLWADADIAVLPSYREGLPLVIIEAAAAGVPAVVTDCTGGPESVEDGVTGLVVPRRSPAALADAIVHLLDEPATRHAMGSAARKRALERYNREELWAAYDDLLRHVATRARSARNGSGTRSASIGHMP